MSLISKSLSTLASIVAGGFSIATTWPIMSGKLGYDHLNSIVNTTYLTYTLAKHFWGNLSDIKPSAVVASIPLPSVDELSHGISDREVRYRANGGVFLAHQSGGNESLRIVGRAWGDKRFLFLNMLDMLFLWGSATYVDVFTLQRQQSGTWQTLFLDESTNYANRTFALSQDPWEEFNMDNLNEGYKEQHLTFPVITKNRVYISMYIETYSWRQRLDKEGRKMVEYTIFFRKYEPPPEYEFGALQVPRKDGGYKLIEVYKQKQVNRPAVYSFWKAITEIMATLSINQELFNIDNIQDFGQQAIMNYFGVNRKEGRIPGIIEQRGYF